MSESKYNLLGPTGYLVIFPNQIIEIPKASNLSWLPMFYALPQELIDKRPAYSAIPRNIHALLSSPESLKLIENDLFLELVWDCYAWSIWQFLKVPMRNGTYRDIPGDWGSYSGNFPLWRMCYYLQLHFREKFEHEMDFSFQRLFMMPKNVTVPQLDYKHFSNLVGNLTDMIVEKQKLQPMIDNIWNNRQVEDYSSKDSLAKKDFMKHWTHARSDSSVKAILSLEDLVEHSDPVISADHMAKDPAAYVASKVDTGLFLKSLSDEDKLMLQLRMEGKTLGEVAKAIGLQSPGAVSKRIAKLAERFHVGNP